MMSALIGSIFQEYLYQPSVMSNEKMCRQLQKELLLAHSNLLRLTLSGKGVQPSVDALRRCVGVLCLYAGGRERGRGRKGGREGSKHSSGT